MLAFLLLSSHVLTTTHGLPDGGLMTITSSGKPSQNARIWSCAEPTVSTTFNGLTSSENGASFTDPEGKGSGTASWSGIKRSFYEGEKVTVTMKCTNMTVSFTALSCANGEDSFRRGIRHPWDPDRSTLTFEFTFKPAPGRTRVGMNFMSGPGVAGRNSSHNTQVSWAFTPGASVTPPQKSSLTAVDAQRVVAGHFMRGSAASEVYDIETYIKDVESAKGIAADGASLLLLRAPTEAAGTATFTVSGAGGALYPLVGQVPLKSAGVRTLQVSTRPAKSGKHYALALYRPPSYFGRARSPKPIDFKVKFAAGVESSLSISLVPPPIVLVHGTYDNPRFCYRDHADEDDTPMNMAPMLESFGYNVWCTDWEETNGNKDPSAFEHNRMTVWQNPGGIREALEATRRKGIVVTQADVICHSQGGAITRTYARGYPFSVSMPPNHPHYNDPNRCKSGNVECWYHRSENYYLGDIHRLITISTTHRGSHVLNVFKGLATYPDNTAAEMLKKALVDVFLFGIDKGVSGITTAGVLNQIPDSLELQLIGPTPVASHAIACVASDEDMRNQRPDGIGEAIKLSIQGRGNYWNKFYKVWLGTSNEARDFLFVQLCKLAGENGMPNPDFELFKYRELAKNVDSTVTKSELMDLLIYQMRHIVFQGLENDCTVGIKSSFGGLEEPFRTRVPNTLHGWAPRYRAVQLRVLRLLTGDGSDFDYDGFPGYSGIKSKASSFATVIPPLEMGAPIQDSAIPINPNFKPYLKAGTSGSTTGGTTVGSSTAHIGGVDFSPERLVSPDSWKDNSGFGGTAKFENGRLVLASPNEPEAEANTFLKSPLRGDFDLVIDYRLESWKAKGEGQVQWDVMLSPSPRSVGEDYILLGRRTTTEGDLIAVNPWKELPGDEAKAATPGGGKLRVTRKGAKWQVSQWDGKAWKTVLAFESADHPEVYLGFGLSTGGEAENAKVSVQLSRGQGERP